MNESQPYRIEVRSTTDEELTPQQVIAALEERIAELREVEHIEEISSIPFSSHGVRHRVF